MDSREVLRVLMRIFSSMLFAFSLISAVTGLMITGLGIFVFVDMSPGKGGNMVMAFSHVLGPTVRPSLFRAALFMVVAGIVIAGYGITSMIAVCKKSYRLMCLFVFFLVVCLIFESVTGVYVVKYQQEVDSELYDFLQWTIKDRYEGLDETTDFYSTAWDYVHKQYSCCGVINGTDWLSAEQWNRTIQIMQADGSIMSINLSVPLSCCKLLTQYQHENQWTRFDRSSIDLTNSSEMSDEMKIVHDQSCLDQPTRYNSHIENGCYGSLSKHILQYNTTILSGVVILLLIQIGGTLLTIVAYKLVRRQRSDSKDFTVSKSFKRITTAATGSKERLSPRAEKRKYAYFDDDFDEHWESGF